MRWFSAAVFSLVFAQIALAETPIGPTEDLEGGFVQRRPLPAEFAHPRIDRLTWSLLAADGASRVLDAYPTRRMLKNSCSSGLKMAGTSTCNYEQNLPGFIANHASGLSAFEGAMWLSEFTATRSLVRHHHPRLARFVPLIDFLSTTSFAVNNLTLSIGESTAVAPAPSKQRGRR
jgi:hypothetical protein